MIPDMCDGEAGCAYGNQVWNGTNPALIPKPVKNIMKSKKASAGCTCAVYSAMAENW